MHQDGTLSNNQSSGTLIQPNYLVRMSSNYHEAHVTVFARFSYNLHGGCEGRYTTHTAAYFWNMHTPQEQYNSTTCVKGYGNPG